MLGVLGFNDKVSLNPSNLNPTLSGLGVGGLGFRVYLSDLEFRGVRGLGFRV